MCLPLDNAACALLEASFMVSFLPCSLETLSVAILKDWDCVALVQRPTPMAQTSMTTTRRWKTGSQYRQQPQKEYQRHKANLGHCKCSLWLVWNLSQTSFL